jgi:hypothetical protein
MIAAGKNPRAARANLFLNISAGTGRQRTQLGRCTPEIEGDTRERLTW